MLFPVEGLDVCLPLQHIDDRCRALDPDVAVIDEAWLLKKA